MNSQEPALIFDNASFAYSGHVALSGVTGEVYPGEALALIGPNGSGKTTLLRGILREITVTGTMEILGVPVSGGQHARRRKKIPLGAIGYVPQVADLDPTFPVTVQQVVEMGLYAENGWFRRLSRSQRQRAMNALERVGLAHRAKERFGSLSGGQQQRVLVARAVAARPKIILLDEPFNGLDQPNREALLDIIDTVKKDGVAVVVSTHDLLLAERQCEKVALFAGRQIAFGPRQEVLQPELLNLAYSGRNTDALTGIAAGAAHGDSAPERGSVSEGSESSGSDGSGSTSRASRMSPEGREERDIRESWERVTVNDHLG